MYASTSVLRFIPSSDMYRTVPKIGRSGLGRSCSPKTTGYRIWVWIPSIGGPFDDLFAPVHPIVAVNFPVAQQFALGRVPRFACFRKVARPPSVPDR